MRSKFLAAGLVLIAMLVLLPKNSRAAAVHAFECKTCHIAGVSFTDLTSQVCRQCHNRPTQTHTFSDLSQVTPSSGFLTQDASDWFGHGVAGGGQTSHNWAAPTDVVPAAGAQAPSTASFPGFYSRYGTSVGKVTCTRCHNPHGDAATDPKLYPTGITSTDQLCTACHVAFNVNNPNGLMTHPVGVVYDSAAAGFQPIDNGANGGVALDGSNKITCSTCHGAHFVDSDASTADVYGVTGGDGLLLKHNGPSKENPTVGDSICQACHTYKGHGMAGNPIGCMVCHGGHVYDSSGSPNYFMLNKQITLNVDPTTGADISASPMQVTLDYTADPTTMTNYDNGTGVYGAICLSCHTLPSGHQATDPCASCHAHDQATGSFGAGCGSCHGYAPYLNADGNTTLGGTSGGYAHSNQTPSHNYSTSGSFKDESLTPHASHANGAGNYTYTCENCHGVGAGSPSSGTHDQGTFQNVLDQAGLPLPALPAQGGLTPTYDTTGSGTCSAVYCHSNGDPLGGTIQTVSVTWAGQKGSIIGAANECEQCHGNTAATMLTKGNSAGHQKHLGGATANAILDRTYSCAVCHSSTASSNTALVAAAIGGMHADGTKDVVSDLAAAGLVGTITYASGGTCQSVYCHSDGKGHYQNPDWTTADNATMTRCTMCHNNGTDDGVVANAAPNTGAHLRHVKDASGPQLGCDACHPANSANGTHAEHIDGTLQSPAQAVCDACHGATSGGTAVDAEPVWTDATSVSCEICHVGTLAVVGTRTAPAKTQFSSTGHGKTGVAVACTSCHATTSAHFNGVTDSNMLTGGATANDAFCQTCHNAKGSHYNNTQTPGGTSTPADSCAVCHEPHGEGMGTNTDVMLIVGTGFTDRNAASSYWNASFTGVCQTCHDPNDGTGGSINHYNRTTADGHNSGTKCVNCHTHNATPAFAPGAGTNCGDCHGFPPADSSHPGHSIVVDGTIANEDRSDCAYCHTGADLYTYDQAADAASGVAGRSNHGISPANRQAVLATTVGYDSATQTCASACHTSTAVNGGGWAAGTALDCDACHGNPPADGGGDSLAHSKHIATGMTCATCHVTMPTDTSHIDGRAGATDIAKIQDAAQALPDEANVVISTWNDTNNTCANGACHNPSGDSHLADWDTSTSSCLLCHNSDVASGSPMASGSHTSHINNAGIIGDNYSCSDCHTDPAGNMAHRDGTVDVNAALNFGTTSPNTCDTQVCHNDGVRDPAVRTAVETPTWGTDIVDDCNICHSSPNGQGDHQLHFDAARVTNGMRCSSCHSNTAFADSSTRLKTGNLHTDGSFVDVAAGGSYSGSPVSLTYNVSGSPSVASTCSAASCHASTGTRTWEQPASCEACHSNLNADPRHAAHITIDNPGISNDRTECAICHGSAVTSYTLVAGGSHQDGTLDLAAGISNTTCASACHASTASDGNWTDSDGLNCDACHGYPPTGNNHSKHIAAGMTCSDCHGAVDTAGTHPLTHNHAKGGTTDGAILQQRGKDFLNPNGTDVNVDDATFNNGGGSTWVNSTVTTDAGNTCSNVYCHDPSDNGTVADWDTTTATCATCHGDGDVAGGTNIGTGSHTRHLDATAKFGLTINCDRCHPSNASNAHFIGTGGADTLANLNKAVQFGGTVISGTGTGNAQYSGDVALPNSGVAAASQYGTCGTSACHNNGMGGAPVATYTWGTAVATDCQTCHNDPPNLGRHSTHLGNGVNYGPHGGTSTWTCGDCHAANSSATQAGQTMAGQATHINGSINFNDGNAIADHGGIFGAGSDITTDTTVTACNSCHGGQTAADLAKAQWLTTNRLACQSCHGDYTAANSAFDGSGVAAPAEAGTAYDTSGHGKEGVACTSCHDNTSAHISGVLNDANRLQVVNGQDYSADANAFCNACHTTLANSAAHYANTQTAGGSSSDGTTCVTCHDQHGQNNGQDAMIASTIQTRTVSGFTDRTQRSSYANAANQGVCQVCHDPNEVQHFNRTTEELATHNSGNCLTCHKHSDTPIFAPSGCNGCHGGGTTGATSSNYWPDGSNANAENTAGRHAKHMEQLSLRQYGLTLTGLLDDAGSDAKQKALCAFCHTNPGADADHGNPANLPAEVNSMAQLWDGAADNAVYNAATDSCSSVNCHNGKTTTTGTFGWYDAGVATCTMCHTAGGAGPNPTTGLHVVTQTGVTAHDDSLGTNGCTECHNAMPAQGNAAANTHINGTFAADSAVNTDRGITVAGNVAAFSQAAVGTSDSCAANCHSDGGNWQRLWSKDADSTATTLGSARCKVCHGQLNDWRAGLSVDHNLTKINDGTHTDCTQCHVAPDAPYDFASMHENDLVEINNNAAMSYNTTNGTCSVSACHGSTTPTRGPGASTIFTEDLLNGPGASCNSCHLATGGSANTNTILGYTFHNRTGAHGKHVLAAATAYGSTATSTQAGSYNYGCGVCHPTDEGTYHQNGTLDLLLDPTTAPGTIKALNGGSAGYSSGTCSAVYCHSDGVDVAAGSTPDFLTGSFSNPNGDYCQNCHGNQPTTSSHAKHVVGIHYDDIYTGTSGLIAGAAASGAGHGDVTTSITITCALCHNSTVSTWENGNNTECVGCHGSTGSATDKTVLSSADLDKTLHVNGVKDVSFAPVDPVRSKAQVRDFSATEPELNNNWQRVGGYKVDSTSHDETVVTTPLNTATMWNGGTKNCTVACHNGNNITWGAASISCNACHTQLPK